MKDSLRQSITLVLLATVLGVGGNALRKAPLPLSGPLGPVEEPLPEPGSDLVGLDAAAALQAWEEGAIFFDLRPSTAWEAERVAGALSLQADTFQDRYFETVGDLDPDMPLVLYASPADSFAVKRLAAHLTDIGHSDVRLVTGGLVGLLAAGIDAEAGAAEGGAW